MFRPGESGVPPVRPIVYHPHAETDPASYERYADPAAAHGWENAYDETAELPRVRPAEGEPGGRGDRRRAAARTNRRYTRRVLTAVGAVGAVALAAVVVGMSFSGDPGGDQRGGGQGDTRSAPDDAVSPSDRPTPAASGSVGAAEPTPVASAAAVPSSSEGTATATPSAGSTAGAATGPATSVAPSVSASASGSGKGNPGRGRGRDKGGR
ncbi:hypothetical protein OG440_13205 [Streptomyces sp. NBC_00637]|uniref:hypothetical protein n=1 Tax=Streptomyces sp. NBC_00637 TaxID=2903667 RepID=UPI003248D8AD